MIHLILKGFVAICIECSSLLLNWFHLWVNGQSMAHDLGVDPYYVSMHPCKHVLVLA